MNRCPMCFTPTGGPPSKATACGACGLAFPPGWVELATTCVAMTGARTTGKSIYVAVAVHQLQRLAHMYGTACAFYDVRSQRDFETTYEGTLFRDRRLIDATAAAVQGQTQLPAPLLLKFGETIDGRHHVLVLRDVPGENLEQATLDARLFTFLRNADALLFLVDPLTIQSVAAMLGQRAALGAQPEHVLSGLTRVITGGVPGGKVSVPVGIVLSKFDTVQGLEHVESEKWSSMLAQPGAAMQRDPSLDALHFDADDSDLLQLEVASLMHEMKGQEFLSRIATTFGHTRLFAVSALGNQPRGQRLHQDGIAPFRVLDPLKWALSRSTVIGEIRPRTAQVG